MPHAGSKQTVSAELAARVVLRVALCVAVVGAMAGGPGPSGVERPRCLPQEERCEDAGPSASGEYIYKVDGRTVIINYSPGKHFTLECKGHAHSAEHPALPRFSRGQRVQTVTLVQCGAPADTYARALAALNVSAAVNLSVKDLPAEPPLRPNHFEGLANLTELVVSGMANRPRPRLPAAALAPLQALRELTLTHVTWEGAHEPLPGELRALRLWFTGTSRVAPSGAPELAALTVHEEGAVAVDTAGAPMLARLVLASRSSELAPSRDAGMLRQLHIDNWTEQSPQPWLRCGQLEVLNLRWTINASLVLPDGWVSACRALRELALDNAALEALSPRALRAAGALRVLRLRRAGLRALPEDLLAGAPLLTELNLSHNALELADGRPLAAPPHLELLDLSDNRLQAAAALALSALTSLRVLRLRDNPQLADLCSGGTTYVRTIAGPSPLSDMKNLTELDLHGTGVTRICRDWRRNLPQLMQLDLTATGVVLLEYDDVVEWRIGRGADVSIGSASNELWLDYSYEDYERSRRGDRGGPPDVRLRLQARVHCDCSAYWAALVFRTDRRHPRDAAPRCRDSNATLADVPLDRLTCSTQEQCPRACTCVKRPDPGAERTLVVARCEGAGLDSVPGPLPNGSAWHLLLADNRVGNVRVGDLPPNLRKIDLTRNAIEAFREEEAAALFAGGREVLLAGNPLRCDCAGLPLVRALAAGRVNDSAAVTCRGGARPPRPDALVAQCAAPPPATIPVALAVLLAVAAVALALSATLASGEMRLRARIVLERLGWWPPPPEEEGADAHRYDAFVSHAHEDEEWVRALVERLERGGWRVCVHYRDWAPGEWIPAQIAASVRTSRRTLAVVSRHFLRSAWARLEFREAHARARRDAAPHLLVLLLEEPAALALDAEMRAFVENNTYVRCDDPWFWRKLEHAMPRRRRPAPDKQ